MGESDGYACSQTPSPWTDGVRLYTPECMFGCFVFVCVCACLGVLFCMCVCFGNALRSVFVWGLADVRIKSV